MREDIEKQPKNSFGLRLDETTTTDCNAQLMANVCNLVD